MDDRDIAFNTSKNYLKRYSLTTNSHSMGGSASGTVTHSLGYLPAVRVFYEFGSVMFESYGNSFSPPPAADGCYVTHGITTSTVTYFIGNTGAAKTVKVHVLVYVDDLA